MADSPQERYERIQEVLQEAILRDYPNPERKDCLRNDVLRRMAGRPRPVRDADWEHVTHCSPCYKEFLEFRSEILERQQSSKVVWRRAVIAALLLIAAGISGYFLANNRDGSLAKRQPPPVVTQNQSLVSAVLNLESQSATRGPEQRPVGEIQRLPRKRLALSVYLPFGSEPGDYEVRLLNREADTAPISTYKGAAEIENGLTILRLVVDLSSLSDGPYVLATRRGDETWRYFRFVVG